MSLALVIPVHNDQRHLDRLLDLALRLGVFDQVIVCDDGSDPPARLPGGTAIGPRRVPLTLVRRETPGGAGAARNAALPWVSASHLLYFDSDDLLTPELAMLWRDLAGRDFDLCLFRYHDSARDDLGGWGQTPRDEALWRLAGVSGQGLTEVAGAARWILAETGNFPWNKIYRTDFLRAHGLRCGETAVHNDIDLHWGSFLAARQLLVSDRIAALHVVRAGGGRLTNRTGRERLEVFIPLRRIAATLGAADAPEPARTAFLRFAAGLLTWVESVLDPGLLPEFHQRCRAFLRNALPQEIFAGLTRTDPVLALRLCLMMDPATRARAGGTPC